MFTLSVQAQTLPIITASPQTQWVPLGTNMQFSVQASGSSPLAYQWYFNGVPVAYQTNNILTIVNAGLGQYGGYFAIVTNDAGSATSAVATLGFLPSAQAEFNISRDFTLSNNPFGVWTAGWKATNRGAFTPYTFKRTVKDEVGVDSETWARYSNDDGSLQRHAFGSKINGMAGSGQAIFAPGIMCLFPGSNPNTDFYAVARFTVPAGAGGTYIIRAAVESVWNGSLSGDADFRVEYNSVELFSNTIAPSTTTVTNGTTYNGVLTLSPGDTVDFMGGRGLEPNSSGAGLKLYLSIDCMITNPNPPSVYCPLANLTFSDGDLYTFSAQVLGAEPISMQWQCQNTNLPGATNSYLPYTAALANAGTYQLIASNMYGMTIATAAVVTVTVPATTITVTPSSVSSYVGFSTSFVATASGPLPITYQWQWNGTNLVGATSNTLVLSNLSLSQSGSYRCVATGPYTNVTSSAAVLTMQPITTTCVDDFDTAVDATQWFSITGGSAYTYAGFVSGSKSLVFIATSGTRQATTRPLSAYP